MWMAYHCIHQGGPSIKTITTKYQVSHTYEQWLPTQNLKHHHGLTPRHLAKSCRHPCRIDRSYMLNTLRCHGTLLMASSTIWNICVNTHVIKCQAKHMKWQGGPDHTIGARPTTFQHINSGVRSKQTTHSCYAYPHPPWINVAMWKGHIHILHKEREASRYGHIKCE